MDYVEAASLLGSSIALSGEFQTWKEAEAALIIDPKAQTLIKEYKDLQVRMVEGSRQDLAKEELERIRDTLMAKQQQLNEYEVTKKYFDGKVPAFGKDDGESGFDADVKNTLSEAVVERNKAMDEYRLADAEYKGHVNANQLVIKACYVDDGPTLKRIRPRAKGSASRIRKRTSHITIIVSTREEA